MKIGRNELCPCGSNMKYKKCCDGKSRDNLDWKNFKNNAAVKNMISKRMNHARIKTCLHPKKTECSGKIIKAHSIQNNRILSSISDNGHVMMFKPALDRSRIDANMMQVGRTVATTFTGFCAYHDKTTFEPIEDRLYEDSPEQNFLFAYRAFAFDRHKKLEQINVLRGCIKDKPQILENSNFIEYFRGNQAAENDLNKYTAIFDKAIIDNNFEIIESIKINLNGFARIAVSSAYYLQYDIQGNLLNDINTIETNTLKMIMVNIFPQENNTFIILSWLKENSSFFAEFKKQILSLDVSSLFNVLNNLIPYYSENFAISPKLWESFDDSSKKEIQSVFNAVYDIPAKGLTEKRSYNLFKDLADFN